MDTGTLIVAAVFVAICIVPFVFIGRGRRIIRKKFNALLTQMAEKDNRIIVLSDIIGNFGIGIDDSQSRVYFVRKINDNTIEQVVLLSEYKNCKINTTSNHFDGGEKVVVGIELVFTGRAGGKPEMVLNLYNEDSDSSTLQGELQAAEKWERIVKSALNKAPNTNFVPAKSKTAV